MWERQAVLLFWFTGTVALQHDSTLVQHKYNVIDEDVPVALRADEKAVLVETEDQQEAEVRFIRHGNEYSYKMSATSVYADDATATAWTENGLVDLKRRNRFFKSREQGMWAQATLHEDGTVSGLFEDQGRIMRIIKGEHRFLKPPTVRTREEVMKSPQYHHYHDDEGDSHLATIDTYEEGMPHSNYDGESSNYPLPSSRSWDGELWYPDCYAGDSDMHDLKIEVLGDTKAHNEVGSTLQASMEQAVAEASFVYERQMHLRIVIDTLKIYETTSGLSGKEKDINSESCVDTDSENVMVGKLDDMKDFKNQNSQAFQGVSHLFTGCGNGVGVIGIAWVGTLCDRVGYNTGVNQMTGDDTFLTFAHELGHNFGMYHPFSAGKENSDGGIMDYGNGLLNGYYQFNKAYRRAEACPVLDDAVNKCEDKFGLQAPTFAPTPFPTTIPAVPEELGFLAMIINFITQLLESMFRGAEASALKNVGELQHAETNFKALVHNVVYKNMVAIAHKKLEAEDETELEQKILDAMKTSGAERDMERLVDILMKMNPTEQEFFKSLLPHLDISDAYGVSNPPSSLSVKAKLLDMLL